MKHRSIFMALVALFATTLTLSAQYDYPFEYVAPEPARTALLSPENTSRELLPAHRAVVHYPSREAFEAGTPEDMLIELTGWQVESLDGQRTRYTTRFKRNYKFDDRELVLQIEGVLGAVSVEVNDQEVGYSASASGRSEFDLTKALRENNNTISIVVYRDYVAKCLEGVRKTEAKSDDFLRARLITSPRVAVSDVVANTTFNAAGDGILNLGIVMQSFLLNSKVYEVYYELHSPEGKVVASANKSFTTRMLSRDTVNFFARVPKVKAWSHKEPNLYKIVVYTKHEKRVKEYAAVNIGFRTAELKDGKLLINGSQVDLVPRVVDFAESREATHKILSGLVAEGVNLVAPTHPQPDEYYDICDSLGLMVCDQTDINCEGATQQDSPSNQPVWKKAYAERALQMYYSSKGHPSVVMFSLARNAQNGICLYESYLTMKGIKGEQRPIVYPEADGQWNSDL